MDERKQVVVGVIPDQPDQEDSRGNFSQTDPGGGPGDRPVVRPYLEPSPEPSLEPDTVSGRPGPAPDESGAGPSALPPDVTGE